MKQMQLTENDYLRAASELRCQVAAIKAVVAVEAAGNGFLPDGQVKILFEPHIFSRYTNHRYDKSHPKISYRSWKPGAYGAGGQNQHDKLAQAAALDRNAALMATSWGAGQVMGFNWKVCGYSSLQAFVNDVSSGAPGQLRAMVGYIKNRGLADELQRGDFAGFAEGYNGDGYAANKYDVKLYAAFRRFGGV
jgi:hypothetical protein